MTGDGPEPIDGGDKAAPPAAGRGPGALVKAAREAQDLSQEEVADALRLLVRIVNDLEEQNWDRLPATTFTRGYYRAYAKFLELDVDAVLAAYTEVASARAEAAGNALAPVPRRRSGPAMPPIPVASMVIIAVALIGLVLWTAWPDGGEDAADAGGSDAATDPRADQAPAPVLPVAPPTDETPAPGTSRREPGAVNDRAREAEAPPASPGVDRPAEARLDTPARDGMPAIGESAQRRITPTGDDRLRIAFANDCWVEVKDLEGRQLYSDLSRAGETLQLVGDAPFSVLLGYAPGADVRFNGEPISLRTHTRNNVASFTVDPQSGVR